MKNRLYHRLMKIAFVAAPIMALYGVSPVYIFKNIQGKIVLLAGFGLWLDILFFWLVNIRLIAIKG